MKWEISNNCIGGHDVLSRVDDRVMYVVARDLPIEDARLIAAAPELYEALQQALPALERAHSMTRGGPARSLALHHLNQARAALAKARGETV